MSKHFLFASLPEYGHVNPTLPVVEELVQRGHRVTYATHEKFARAIDSTGATLLPTSGTMPPVRPASDAAGWEISKSNSPTSRFPVPHFIPGFLNMLVDATSGDLPGLLEYVRENPPDAVCYDVYTPAGKMLAGKLGVPDIELIPMMASNDHFSTRTAVWEGGVGPESTEPTLLPVAKRLRDIAQEFDVPAPTIPVHTSPASLNIAFLPREFQIAGETFDERFRFVGPSLDARAFDSAWMPPDDGRPLLFVSLGTVSVFNLRPDFFQMCLEAFGDTEWHVAMAIGEFVDPASLGRISDNIDVRPYFPQPAVLSHARACIGHAGLGTTMQSLASGVPLVAVPQFPEHAINGGRVEELGLGRQLDTTALSPEMLRTAVTEVSTSDEIRANLEKMREAIRNAGGAAAAADAIEAHVVR